MNITDDLSTNFRISPLFFVCLKAHLRSVDVKILQQLLAVHEGIEAVKWLMEERSTLTSHCSSLTSSQYSLGEGPDSSWRGSWSSLQDPTNEKLDNISIGSYLDTLADDMDEYCPSSSESVICSTTPLASEATSGARITGGPGATVALVRTGSGVGIRAGNGAVSGIRSGINNGGNVDANGTEVRGSENGVNSANTGTEITGTGTGKPAVSVNSPQVKSESSKKDVPVRSKPAATDEPSPLCQENTQTQAIKANGVLEKATTQTGSPIRANLSDKLGTSQSPKLKPYKNGKIDLDTCKMNGKRHLEYDAHWRWVQSQEDVTFL